MNYGRFVWTGNLVSSAPLWYRTNIDIPGVWAGQMISEGVFVRQECVPRAGE